MDMVAKKIKGTIYSDDIHEVEKRQHQPDPLEKITRTRIPVFNDYGYCTENTINNEKVKSVGGKTFEKTTYGPENTRAKHEQVHEQDVGTYNPGKN
jgi:hypothetical protein